MALDELDDRIANLPPLVDDPAYLVFADWLQSRGDPWGELISLQSNPRTPEIDREIDRAVAFAEASPPPGLADLLTDVL